MKKIEVAVLQNAGDQVATMNFLAKLTQRGHAINDMDSLIRMWNAEHTNRNVPMAEKLVDLPHGTIKRFAPVTIAIVGASRRFLGQARTHQVGMDYVSASLQYSNYSDSAAFTVPYDCYELDSRNTKGPYFDGMYESNYLKTCRSALADYKEAISEGLDSDAAGYMMPQGMRNIVIMQGNMQSWDYFIRLRGCNRNTKETQYVTLLIWEALQKDVEDGKMLYAKCGPDCAHFGKCREGNMSCKNPWTPYMSAPNTAICKLFPLIREEPF